MTITTILVTIAILIAVSTVYTMYKIRNQRREERRFNEIMKIRIKAIATY